MLNRSLPILSMVILLFALAPPDIVAQSGGETSTVDACYVPDVGALYLINLPGLPTDCLAGDHEAISWSAGTGATDHGDLTGLADDDHPQYLLTDGVRTATNGFAVTGTLGTGSIPIEGEGARILWYPGKVAFRAGSASSFQWDDANIGVASVALGANTLASGRNSTALGIGTTASGDYTTALGLGSTASGDRSIAIGRGATASGSYTTAMGFDTNAQAAYSMAIGRFNVLEGDDANWVATDPLFVAGNGTYSSHSNALTLLKNGNLTIAGTLTESSDARLKTEIEPIGDVLDALQTVHPVRFTFLEGTGHPTSPQIGVVAQEVAKIFPELVSRDDQGYLSVAYPKLTAVLLRGIQEQQATIEQQRVRMDQMDERIARLEAIVGQAKATAP